MPEYIAISLVAVGFLLFVTLTTIAVTRHLSRLQSQFDDSLSALSSQVKELTGQIAELQQGVHVHGRDLEAIRAEFVMHVTRDNASEIDYELAIKAAAGGVPADEVSERYGLREQEAQLLVAVYGK